MVYVSLLETNRLFCVNDFRSYFCILSHPFAVRIMIVFIGNLVSAVKVHFSQTQSLMVIEVKYFLWIRYVPVDDRWGFCLGNYIPQQIVSIN